jgi:hypothetical protein
MSRATILDQILNAALDSRGLLPFDVLGPLTAEPVYAIPEELIDGLDNRRRRWLDAAELALERRFLRFCRGCVGIFHGRFLQHRYLGQCQHQLVTEEHYRDLGWHHYLTFQRLQESLNFGQNIEETVRQQQEAYLGWLITYPTFLTERNDLRVRWQAAVNQLGFIPSNPVDLRVEQATSLLDTFNFDDDELVADFSAFYQRWQLTGLVTWDLPEPVGANLGAPASVGRFIGVENRPAVQLPPTVHLPSSNSLHDLVQSPLEGHLAEWQMVLNETHPSGFGFDRWQRVFRFHFLRNIVLSGSYEARFRRRAGELDWVFAELFGDQSDESCRRIRLWINRQLNPQGNASHQNR